MNSFKKPLLIVPNQEPIALPQPTQSNAQRKQSGNKSNGIESLGPSNLFFLFSPFFLLHRRKKCLADEKRARMPRFSAMNSSLPIMAI